MIDTIAAAQGGLGMSILFLVAVLWGSAFSRTLTFRVMCSGILMAATAALVLYDVAVFRILFMTFQSVVLMILALKSLPHHHLDRTPEATS